MQGIVERLSYRVLTEWSGRTGNLSERSEFYRSAEWSLEPVESPVI